MIPLDAALWTFAAIQSPFLISCSYPLLERFKVLASPYVVLPGVAAVSIALYFADLGPFAFYSHFLVGGALFAVCYLTLSLREGYSEVQSLVLSALTVIACDELWQTPFNVLNWTHSLAGAEAGLMTAGWELMAVPLLFFFLLRFGRTLRPNWRLLTAVLSLTVIETTRFYLSGFLLTTTYPPYEPYYMIGLWFWFFLILFRK